MYGEDLDVDGFDLDYSVGAPVRTGLQCLRRSGIDVAVKLITFWITVS